MVSNSKGDVWARLNPRVRRRLDEFCNEMGISRSRAIGVFVALVLDWIEELEDVSGGMFVSEGEVEGDV